ncbi:MAG: DNA topoisomerase 4 subunit A, partial [Lactobacillus sp.]|nr:DNA topoisomerase 4 subunit A [Lactobacillus sp.]
MTTDERIREMPLEQVMGERFGRYSKYIIQERALPDIRDGLKPVQRRILYAMYQDNNTFDKPYKKAAKAVGNIMGNFHPHGDSSIYGALVHLSQSWRMREPLIEMHGNNGSMDGDGPAAMRYTESRLSRIANVLLQDIDKETVNMVLNFDDTEYEPTVLPARFPNLLVNGSTGISAGYATAIPSHNLSEVIDATIYLLKHPDASLDDLMQFVQGPDFPTGAIVLDKNGLKEAYETGRGRIQVRAKTTIQEIRGHRQQIVATEIPFDVNKATLVKKMDEIRVNREIDGIAEVRDETDRHGLSVVVELKKDADAQNILNYLFKNTELQVSYNFNMVAIDRMTPVQVGLKRILASYLAHEREVVTNRTRYNLHKAEVRLEIVAGLIHVMDILDAVIKTIRASKNKADAQANLVKQYQFTKRQAEAIVSLQLYRLTNTDVVALVAEQKQLTTLIAG